MRVKHIISMSFIVVLLSIGTSVVNAQSNTNYCQTGYCDKPPACDSSVGGGVSYSGQTLKNTNFSGKPAGYLKGADFSNTTLIGVNFANADLTNANFQGAKFQENTQGIRSNLSGTTLTNTCFSGANLSGASLLMAQFNDTDFSCADLKDTEFGPLINVAGSSSQRTQFNYANMGVAVNNASYLFPFASMSAMGSNFWPLVDFTCTRLIGLSKQNFNTVGINLSEAKLAGQVLTGYQFYDATAKEQCNLSAADFTGTDFSNSNFQYCNLDGVTLAHAILDGADFTEANFYTNNNASDLTNTTLNGTILNNATLSHADMAGAVLTNVQAVGQDTDFSSVNMQSYGPNPEATITNSSFKHADFSSAAINNVTFANSRLNNVSFLGQTLTGTDFSGSQLVGSNFQNTKLQNVKFRHADMSNANFESSTLIAISDGAGPDFTCAQLGGSNFSSATVSKANFNAAVMPQASDCCAIEGGYNCGIAANGMIYGAATVPTIPANVNVDCPNGQDTNCTGSDWKVGNNWKTNTCDGHETTVWTKPSCGSGPKTITIKDANLKTCLQQLLFNGANQAITVAAAANLKYLTCPNMGISDVSVLNSTNFPNLVSLDLSANQLSGAGDFSEFSTQLQTVKLSYNQLTSLTFSANQTALNSLAASDNKLTSVDISANTYLSYLDLSNNQLIGNFSDFYTFSGVVNVSYIDLSNNHLTSVFNEFDLTNTPNLNTLSLHNNNLTSIGSLKKLWGGGNANLYTVTLGNNSCFECNTLCVSAQAEQQFQCSCDSNTCGSACAATCPTEGAE